MNVKPLCLYLILLKASFTKPLLQFINTLKQIAYYISKLMCPYINVHAKKQWQRKNNSVDINFFISGLVQKSSCKMAKEGEEQPDKFPLSR